MRFVHDIVPSPSPGLRIVRRRGALIGARDRPSQAAEFTYKFANNLPDTHR